MRRANYRGFTIVELLIVIVVISVLAAITIVAFNGIQERAQSSAVQSAAVQAKKKISIWQVDNVSVSPSCMDFYAMIKGSLPGAQPPDCTFDDGNSRYQYTPGVSGSYCATITNGKKSYKITDTSDTANAGCPGHGQGGNPAITNLATQGRAVTFQSGAGQLGFRSDRYGSDQDYTILTGQMTPVGGLTTVARTTWKTTNTDSRGFQMGQNPDVTSTTGYPIEASKTYTLSLYSKGSFTSSMNVLLLCRVRDSSGTNLNAASSSSALTANWQRYTLTFDAPANAATVGCRLTISGSNPAAAVGNTLDATGLMLTEGSTVYSYADGNSPNWIWSNSVNNSISTGPAL